jgi:hypothetical protein
LLLDWLKRKKQAKGYGIHSPFAYELITRVIKEEHGYTAFSDIEEILRENILNRKQETEPSFIQACQLFQAGKNPRTGDGAGGKYSLHKRSFERCSLSLFRSGWKKCVVGKEFAYNFQHIGSLLSTRLTFPNRTTHICLLDSFPIDMENLLEMSSGNTFWVISGIKTCSGKRFWAAITADERARITFDLNGIGIVILDKSHHKANYML